MDNSQLPISILKKIIIFVVVIVIAAIAAFQTPDCKMAGHFLFRSKAENIVTGIILFPIILLSLFSLFLLLKRKFTTLLFSLLLFNTTFLLIFSMALFGMMSTRIETIPIKINGMFFSLIRIIGCHDDSGASKHSCENLLFLKNMKTGGINKISFIPEGKSMIYKEGLLYFHQEGCCLLPDLITVIDLKGNLVKLCGLDNRNDNFRRVRKNDLMTETDWTQAFKCKNGKGLLPDRDYY